VIFVSCVLEYVNNIDETIKELYRVSGSKDNLFVVCVNDKSLAAYIYKDNTDISKNLIYIDNLRNISYKKL
jgi:ubiquinone/menaquinone biosynthesis C-methylase UbiE